MIRRGLVLSIGHPKDLTNKVVAIKALRELTGMGLKESKYAVESVRPGKFTSFFPTYEMMKPQLDNIIVRFEEAGFTVQFIDEDNPARRAIGEEVRKLATYATLAAQYDLAKSLIDIADAHCVLADPAFDLMEALGEDDSV